jgi:lipoate-protein ligase B
MEMEVFDLGLIDYKNAWVFQKETFKAVKSRNPRHALILCRHYPVITLGRGVDRKNILADESTLVLKQIGLYEVERGGDVTYHGPGQLIAYPVFNLGYFKKDISLFLRYLEEAIIEFLYDFGIKGTRLAGLTGVWVDNQKIASIGIAIRNWITFHGLSVNIKEADLDNFSLIKPCGMDIKMTSLETLLGRNIEIDDVKENLISKFKREETNDEGSFARVRRGN